MRLQDDAGGVFTSGACGFFDDEVSALVDPVFQSLAACPLFQKIPDGFFVFGLSGNAAQFGKVFPDGSRFEIPERIFL